jgi:PIN domain nuclease of toxin-antitoxin system
LREAVEDSGLRVLQLDPDHGLGVARLPMRHRDPFDRLSIAQARAERLAIVTADRRFAEYQVPVIPAG